MPSDREKERVGWGGATRQMARIIERYRAEGVAGLNSKHYGKKPGNAIADSVRALIIEKVRQRYTGFGPTMVSEKLAEEDVILSEQATRKLSKELSMNYNNRYLQIEHTGTGRGLRGAEVKVHEHFDGRLSIRRSGRIFAYKEIAKPLKQSQIVGSKEVNRHLDALMSGRREHKPAANHP